MINLKMTLLKPIIKSTFNNLFCFLLLSFGIQEGEKVYVLDYMISTLIFDLLSQGGESRG